MNTIFIAHSVYLTPEERKLLGTQPTTIETVGISVPVMTDSKKLTEVFVRYLITTDIPNEEKNIEHMPDGFKISFSHYTDLKPILNIHDEGSEWLLSELKSEVEIDGIQYEVYHQIVFKDVSAQEKTTICEHLGHFLMKK